MSDIMRLIDFEDMINWIFEEYKQKESVFGIRKDKFYQNEEGTKITLFDEEIVSIVGPAAGPSSQLSQNILASYLAGSRVIELKTVQKMDGEDLRACVKKPCIKAEDECYNVEWSTELTVEEALEEYIKAHFLISVFAKEFGLADKKDFLFNMSVGYDLEGIKTPKIDNFIESMKDCKNTEVYKNCVDTLLKNIDKFENVDADFVKNITSKVSGSITLSTLHGCPPFEIDRIARYLLGEKKIHTYVKCNPTLLGYKYARNILDKHGFSYLVFDDHHFKADLQYKDALEMLKGLKVYAKELSLAFGVKITNTFPVGIKNNELEGEEMYMSGRPLFLLSLSVAKKLSDDFNGELPISYSGGADYYNIKDLAETGIKPITVATTILKPGGYERLNQLAKETEESFDNGTNIDLDKLSELFEDMYQNKYYQKKNRVTKSRKTDSKLPLFDCFKAPCQDGGCPINQQIPAYLDKVAKKDYKGAFETIVIDNVSPAITGTICDHNCQNKCTRLDYEKSVNIRNAKKIASSKAQKDYIEGIAKSALKTDKKVCIIGAGPSGISAGIYLRRNGVDVQIFEKTDRPYGIVSHVIPEFRISKHTINKDYELAKAIGVNFTFNTEITSIKELQNEYDFVIIATGSWEECSDPFEKSGNALDALEFLQRFKANDKTLKVGKKVAIIGGGDVAMDCARAAKRMFLVENSTILYRRTKDYMPAEKEEIRLAENDGVNFVELVSPVSFDGETVVLAKMELSEKDASGRRSVVKNGSTLEMEFDTVIKATGAKVSTKIFNDNNIELNKYNCPNVDENRQSSIQNVYVIGDCKSGPSTVVKGMADAKVVTKDILRKLSLENDFTTVEIETDVKDLIAKKGIIKFPKDDRKDAKRCLGCDTVCMICNDVCPNRANVTIGKAIVHLDGMCNECGNCEVFCPHVGAPYKDKFTIFWFLEDFEESTNVGFVKVKDEYFVRLLDGSVVNYKKGDTNIPEGFIEIIEETNKNYSYYLKK